MLITSGEEMKSQIGLTGSLCCWRLCPCVCGWCIPAATFPAYVISIYLRTCTPLGVLCQTRQNILTESGRAMNTFFTIASRIKIPNAACMLADTWPGYCTCSVSLLRSELVGHKLICLSTLASSSAERPCCDTHRPPLTLLAKEDASCLQANKWKALLRWSRWKESGLFGCVI